MAVTQLSLYNDALLLLGERALSSVTEPIVSRRDLDTLYDNGAVDYCLEVVKPRYASLLVSITGITPTATTGYLKQIALPSSGFLTIGVDGQGRPTVYADDKAEQIIERFIHEDSYLLCDYTTVYLRYIRDHSTAGFTSMTKVFGRVVSAYMASQLAWKYDPDREESIAADLISRIEIAVAEEARNETNQRGQAPTALDADWLPIYNDALQMLKLDPIVSATDDSDRKYRLDMTRNAKVVEAVLEDTEWQFGLTSAEVDEEPLITATLGYSYAVPHPSDLHRLAGVWSDNSFYNPIRDYREEYVDATYGNVIFCNYATIWLKYVDTAFLTAPSLWPAYFSRLVAARMAVDANIPGSDLDAAVTQYTTRRKSAMSTDIVSGPPKIIREGSWNRSRGSYGSNSRDRNWN